MEITLAHISQAKGSHLSDLTIKVGKEIRHFPVPEKGGGPILVNRLPSRVFQHANVPYLFYQFSFP